VSELTSVLGPTGPLGDGGVLVDRYHLRGLLGRGGMAEVYLAHDDVLGRPVAVKVFHAGPGSLGAPERQRQEAALLASLNHPGLVTVFDAGVDANRNQAFLVMEIVRGPTLAARLTAGPLPESEVRDIGASLAEALAYVHAHRVVHRDVKPGNVLFTDPEDHRGVKLADFGIARMADSASHTEAGLVVGSARYVSPEQALGAGAGPPTDVYALGLVLLECLTGAPVYAGAGIAAVVARLHRDPHVPDHVDPALRRLLGAMTRRDPALRPSAHEVAASLRQAPGTQLLPSVEAVGDRAKTAGQALAATLAERVGGVHRRAWLAAACTAVIVALAGSAALLEQSAPDNETATVTPPPTATVDAAQAPPATPIATPGAPAQPATQSEAPAEQVANDPGADEGRDEANNQGNGNDGSKEKDKEKDKNKDAQ
jgi:eukaryotic-like serine/threonine-protein kinase